MSIKYINIKAKPSIILREQSGRMKHNIIIAILLLVFIMFGSGNAQKINIGILGGINFAELNIKDDQGEKSSVSTRNAFGAGGVFEFQLAQNVYLQLQPMYLQKGGVLFQEPPDPEEIKFKMSFIEVPLFLKVQLGEQICPYIMGGPTVGYLLSSKLESEIGGFLFKGDLKHLTRKIDFGVGFGAGVSIPVGSSNVFLDGRYTLGLTNLNGGGTFEARAGDIVVESDIKKESEVFSRGFQIMIGIVFPVGG